MKKDQFSAVGVKNFWYTFSYDIAPNQEKYVSIFFFVGEWGPKATMIDSSWSADIVEDDICESWQNRKQDT